MSNDEEFMPLSDWHPELPDAKKSLADAINERLAGLRFRRQDPPAPAAENFVWKGIIPKVGTGIVYGKSGTGKSFFTLALAGCIASKKGSFARRFCARGRVLYVCYEAGSGLNERIRAVELEYNDGEPLHDLIVLEGGIHFGDALDDAVIDQLITNMNAEQPDNPIVLMIVDTVNQSQRDDFEQNDSGNVRDYLRRYDQIAKKNQMFCLGVAHPGKNVQRGVAGSAVWRNNSDVMLLLERTDGLGLVLEFDKLRDGDQQAMEFALRRVPFEQSHIEQLERVHQEEAASRPHYNETEEEADQRRRAFATLIFDDTPAPRESVTEHNDHREPDADMGAQKLFLACLNMRGVACGIDVLRDDFNRYVENFGHNTKTYKFASMVRFYTGEHKRRPPVRLVHVKRGENFYLSLPDSLENLPKK